MSLKKKFRKLGTGSCRNRFGRGKAECLTREAVGADLKGGGCRQKKKGSSSETRTSKGTVASPRTPRLIITPKPDGKGKDSRGEKEGGRRVEGFSVSDIRLRVGGEGQNLSGKKQKQGRSITLVAPLCPKNTEERYGKVFRRVTWERTALGGLLPLMRKDLPRSRGRTNQEEGPQGRRRAEYKRNLMFEE